MSTSLHSLATADTDDNSLDFLCYGNTAVALKLRAAAASPRLPDTFDDFNAKAFIEDVYGRATQI